MEEQKVVAYFKAYLQREKWKVESKVTAGELFERSKLEPDVVATKRGLMLVGEAKGSVDLHELFTGIGQCICYTQYGGNLICFIVPQDVVQEARLLVRSCSLIGNGKIGLFVVKNGGDVVEAVPCKQLKLTQRQREIGSTHFHKLTFIRDLKINELGRLLEKIDSLKNNFESKASLYSLFSESDRDYIFAERDTKGKLKPRSFSNAFIPPTNLGLMDKNGHLTPDGISLANTFVTNRKKYYIELSYLLLTKGHFLAILQSIEKFDHKIEQAQLTKKITDFLNSEKLIVGSKDLGDFANRLGTNHLRWLQELNLLKKDKKGFKINWVEVCNVLRSQ